MRGSYVLLSKAEERSVLCPGKLMDRQRAPKLF